MDDGGAGGVGGGSGGRAFVSSPSSCQTTSVKIGVAVLVTGAGFRAPNVLMAPIVEKAGMVGEVMDETTLSSVLALLRCLVRGGGKGNEDKRCSSGDSITQ
jgi:hypothetical protein